MHTTVCVDFGQIFSKILVEKIFRVNICFPNSFRKNMCKSEANARGSLKNMLFFQLIVFAKTERFRRSEQKNLHKYELYGQCSRNGSKNLLNRQY